MFNTSPGCFGGITKSCASAEGSHLKLWIRLIYSVIWKRQNFFARKFISGSVTRSEYLSGRWPRSKKGFWEPQFGFTQPFWPSRRIIPTFLSVSSPQRLIHLAGPSISFAHSVPLFFCLVILGSVLPSPRKITFPTETIPRVCVWGGGVSFVKCGAKHEFYMGCAVSTLSARPAQNTQAHTNPPGPSTRPGVTRGARRERRRTIVLWAEGEEKNDKKTAIHARTYSSSRMNTGVCSELGSASDQRRCDGCLMFYWSQTSFSVFFWEFFFLPELRTLVENLLQRFEPRTQEALTEEVMLLMWHIWQKKIKKWKWKNAAPELNSHNMLLLWF